METIVIVNYQIAVWCHHTNSNPASKCYYLAASQTIYGILRDAGFTVEAIAAFEAEAKAMTNCPVVPKNK